MTRTAEEIGRTAAGPRPLPALGATREVPLPDVVDTVLPNGLRVLAAHRPGIPMAELRLRVPFAGDAPEHSAVAELLSETLLTGTATRDRVTIDDELAAVGADLGVGVDPERLLVSGSGLAAGLPDVLGVLADVLTAATHPDAEVARERDRLVERITVARAQPRTIAREALQRKRFGDHPITQGDAYRSRRIRRHRGAGAGAAARVARAEGVDPHAGRRRRPGRRDRRRREVAGRLDGRPRGPGAARPRRRSSRTISSWCTGPARCSRSCGSPRPPSAAADPAYAALQLANLVFGGYFSSRWMENIREDKGYTYGAHSGVEFVPGGGVLGLETDVASDVTAAALLETRYELGRLVAVPPTAAEVDAARAYAIGSLAISLDSQGGLASSINAMAAVGLTLDWLRSYPARLSRRHPGGGRGRGAAVLRAHGGHRRGRRRRGA